MFPWMIDKTSNCWLIARKKRSEGNGFAVKQNEVDKWYHQALNKKDVKRLKMLQCEKTHIWEKSFSEAIVVIQQRHRWYAVKQIVSDVMRHNG